VDKVGLGGICGSTQPLSLFHFTFSFKSLLQHRVRTFFSPLPYFSSSPPATLFAQFSSSAFTLAVTIMTPSATSPVFGDKGANGAEANSHSYTDGVAFVTSKLSGLGNVAATAAHGVAGVASALVKQPTMNSKEVMKKESEFGAHK
jgi:hypothetical protein